jgi:hypothetical protein
MEILVRLDQMQRLKSDANPELDSQIRLSPFDKIKAKVKEMTPDGGAAGVNLRWTLGCGRGDVQLYKLKMDADLTRFKLFSQSGKSLHAKLKMVSNAV